MVTPIKTTAIETRKSIHIDAGHLLLSESGIVYFYMKDDLSVTLAVAQEAVSALKRLDNSDDALLLIVMGFNIDVEFPAQRYFSNAIGVKKLAMVVQNKMQIEVARFLKTMMKLFNCAYELRPFYTIEQAENWLLAD